MTVPPTAETGGVAGTTGDTTMKINYYKSNGAWCYAAFIDGEFDHADQVGLPDSATDADVERHLLTAFPGSEIKRVDDV